MKRFIYNIFLTIKTIDNLFSFFLDYFGLIQGFVVYHIRNKSIYLLTRAGSSDKSEVVAVMSGFEYRFDLLPKLKNPIIFDVGAYIGDSALYISDFFRNKCKVYSFEADKDNFELCQINIILNKNKTVKPYYLAIGSKNGRGVLKKKGKNNDAYSATATKTNGISCPMKTLKQIAADEKLKKIDILKMDIEGGEYEIFNNTNSYNFIKSSTAFIFLEYHYDFGVNLVKELLKKLDKDFITLHHRDNLILLKNRNNLYNN